MKYACLALMLIVVGSCLGSQSASSQSAVATEAEVRALLQANGTENVAAQVGPIAAQQLNLALHRANPALSTRADAIVMDVVVSYVGRQAERDHVIDRLIPIYSKYLTKDDVRQVTEFYRSSAGRKLAGAMPKISLESASIGQQWMESIMPGLQAELLDRLRSEKLIN